MEHPSIVSSRDGPVVNENPPRPNAAENTRLHAGRAEQRLARHVVQVEFQRRVATECGRVAREPLASRVPGGGHRNRARRTGGRSQRRPPDVRAPSPPGPARRRSSSRYPPRVGRDRGTLSAGPPFSARRCESTGSCAISSSSSRSRSTFSSVSSRYPVSAASRCSVWTVGGAIQSPSKPRSATSTGTMTFQPLAVLADPGFAPSA